MIDTLILRLHGCNQQKIGITHELNYRNGGVSLMQVPEHHNLYLKLFNYQGKHFEIAKRVSQTTLSNSTMNFEDYFTSKTSNKLNPHFLELNKVRFVAAEKVSERNVKANGKYRVPSSESDVVFSINPDAGYVEFNINVNKYLFGHNLAQFIPQCYSPNRINDNFTFWNTNSKHIHRRLLEFIDSFFLDLIYFFEIDTLPVYEYIELNRIDICYNQFFESREDALQYLEYQKKIRKKCSLEQQKRTDTFETSIQYNTQNGINFKIYHKGSEYINTKHGDFSKHNRINKNYLNFHFRNSNDFDAFKKNQDKIMEMFKKDTLGDLFLFDDKIDKKIVNESYKNLPYNTMFLKSEMDKVLRYEISFKAKALVSIFKNKFFRKRCKIHQQHIRMYKKVRKNLKSLTKLNYNPSKFEYDIYKHMHNFLNTSGFVTLSNERNFKKYCINSSMNYDASTMHYKINNYYEVYQKGTLLETRFCVPFTDQFLQYLVNELKKLIDYYQIEEIQPYDDLVKRVHKYNTEAEKKRDDYNRINDHLTWETTRSKDIHGNVFFTKQRITKGNRRITKASQLLTESQLMKMGFKTVVVTNLIEIFRLIHEKNMSIDEIKKYLKLSPPQFNRRLRLFKMIGLSEQNMNVTKKIICNTDFSKYYSLTMSSNYQKNFFIKPSYFRIDSVSNDKRITITDYKYQKNNFNENSLNTAI
ncbi:hypothetical protein [Tenacibaculum agarivorans]|uniref:hypothetical protein n=1 Tax=Tenacibaculum agarivorans TaxID=1908389 RepID=UPI00094BB173|nr:hypothetical protein [Tenacibaculum agarivorans]